MFNRHYKIQFDSEVSHSERMYHLSKLFELSVETNDDIIRANDYKFNSSGLLKLILYYHPLIDIIEVWLKEKEKLGILKVVE